MAITSGFCIKAKEDFLCGNITGSHTFKMAFFTSAATLDATTLVYASTNEAVGAGYTAGGVVLTGFSSSIVNGAASITFNNVFIPTASLTSRGGMIWDASFGSRSVAIFDFGVDYTSTSGSYQYSMPTSSIRIL